jgi:hypothetical protein
MLHWSPLARQYSLPRPTRSPLLIEMTTSRARVPESRRSERLSAGERDPGDRPDTSEAQTTLRGFKLMLVNERL